ncbi:hypothetical protein CNEO3_20116 [Clostridium neonatale]|nr:hypothetical protein CNEO3_20116 [Clostridium neonatale]
MRLAFSQACSEKTVCDEKTTGKRFLKLKLLYSIGFIFYRESYHSRLGDFLTYRKV